jgi:hypothetical protein
MRTAYVVAIIFFARFFVAAFSEQRNDGDISWQKWIGHYLLTHHELPRRLGVETYTATGAPWVPQEWAIGTAIALAEPFHAFWLLAVIASLAGVGVILLVARTAELRGATTSGILLAAILTGFGIVASFGVRAQVFGWLAFALVLYLDTRGEKARRWTPLVIVLWANLHASAPLGVAYLAMRAAFDRTRTNFLIAAAAFVAIFCTPLGASLPVYAIDLLHAPFRQWISEWQPTTIGIVSVVGVFVPMAIFMLRGLPQQRFDATLACGTVIFAFLAARNVAIASIVLAPIAAAQLTRSGWTLPTLDNARPGRFQVALSLVVASIASVAVWWNMHAVPDFAGDGLPLAAMNAAARSGATRIYCEDFAWCGLALEKPQMRTFLDGRCDPFPMDVWRDYIAVEHAGPTWREVLAKTHTELVLASREHPLAQVLRERKDWRVLYADKKFVLYERAGAAAVTKRVPTHASGDAGRVLATAARRPT